MIKLYHGSNTIVHRIDLSLSKKGKDFGRGFYLNPNKEQAKAMAERTVRRMMSGSPIVNSFWFDDTWLTETAGLKVRIFDDYSVCDLLCRSILPTFPTDERGSLCLFKEIQGN